MPLDPAVIADLLAAGAGVQAFTPPSVVYLAACTTEPTDEEQGTECSGDGYARCAFMPAAGLALVDGSWVNASDVVFAESGEDLGTVVAIAAYDEVTLGNRQWYGILGAGVDWKSDKALRIPATDLTVGWPS